MMWIGCGPACWASPRRVDSEPPHNPAWREGWGCRLPQGQYTASTSPLVCETRPLGSAAPKGAPCPALALETDMTTDIAQQQINRRARGRTPAADAAGQLLAASARGDEHAFTQLHHLYAARVLAVARSITRDLGMAQDITQEVFLEIWRNASRFESTKGPAVPWLLLLTRSRAIDRVRHTEAFRRRDSWYAAHHTDPDSDTVADSVLHRLDLAQVQAMLAVLSPLHLEAITLVYFCGHTNPQASAILGIPLSTFKSRVRDALIKLRSAPATPLGRISNRDINRAPGAGSGTPRLAHHR